ncbi:MAG TPA: hypothetical protein VLI05_07325 [Candidatus Saccharimonadia bacterium]|nr:hypothetical protein [Candidatus Saccharimonadia bacterium]
MSTVALAGSGGLGGWSIPADYYPLRDISLLLEQLGPELSAEARRQIQWHFGIARMAHHGQVRKDGERPFIEHPLAVSYKIGIEWGVPDWQAIVAALLHDTVEDNGDLHFCDDRDFAREQLMRVFGRPLAQTTLILTRGPGQSEQDYFHDFYVWDADRFEREVGWPEGAWVTPLSKVGDRAHNLGTLQACRLERRRNKVAETRQYFLAEDGLLDLLRERLPAEYHLAARRARAEIQYWVDYWAEVDGT